MFTTRYQDLDTLIVRDKNHKTAAGREKWVAKQVEAGAIRVMGYSESTPTATPAPQSGSIAERVVETRTQTPKHVSTRVIDDSREYAWVVGCEKADCDNHGLVAKYDFRPVSFADPNGPAIKVVYTAPGRRYCSPLHAA